ncbi:MAG: MerR family transcriptional regulator [Actinomycetota bacterium]|nr:MerR family transcriptional regulator [Actinomycetota bacterium]
MPALTIHEAAATTGWSPRMLRYVEQLGLVEPPRSASGYRLYGPAELQRLRTLRELLEVHGLELGDVGVALRLRREPDLAAALDTWFSAEPRRPAPVPAGTSDGTTGGTDVTDADWLAFEQAKHQQLLPPTPRSESA